MNLQKCLRLNRNDIVEADSIEFSFVYLASIEIVLTPYNSLIFENNTSLAFNTARVRRFE